MAQQLPQNLLAQLPREVLVTHSDGDLQQPHRQGMSSINRALAKCQGHKLVEVLVAIKPCQSVPSLLCLSAPLEPRAGHFPEKQYQ